MSTEETQPTEEVVVQSDVLSEEQLKETVEPTTTDTEKEEVVLPSDTPEFEMPEKFQGKSAEEIAKSYIELEKMKNTAQEDTPTEEQKDTSPPTETPKQEVDVEYETWKKEKKINDVLEPVGGTEKYKEALAWSKENLTAEEIKAYDNTLKATDDINTIRMLTKGLISQYEAANVESPTEPKILHGNETTKAPKVSGYETKSDMMKDLNDPRYAQDPSYRAKVEAKVAKTDEASWYKGLASY